MNKEAWLQLSDYSNKYRVSVSTLRRRIKAGEIEYQFEEGKYWLADSPIEKYARNRGVAAVTQPMSIVEDSAPIEEERAVDVEEQFVSREELLQVTNSMIAELKSAYVLVLQEKEAQIMEGKKEIVDLKTLCHMLEAENEKLKTKAQAPLSDWFVDEDSEIEI